MSNIIAIGNSFYLSRTRNRTRAALHHSGAVSVMPFIQTKCLCLPGSLPWFLGFIYHLVQDKLCKVEAFLCRVLLPPFLVFPWPHFKFQALERSLGIFQH